MDKALKSVLEWWDATGVDVPAIPSRAPSRTVIQSARQQPVIAAKATTNAPARSAQKPSTDTRPDAALIAKAAKTLADLKSAMEAFDACLLYTSPSPRDLSTSRMPSSA